MNKTILSLFSLLIVVSTVRCAKTDNGSTAATTTTTTCSTGYLYSASYGCQLQCGTSSIWYNNQCIATTTTTTATTTCSAGYLYSTYYGCQQQCGSGMVWYSNQCISTSTSVTTTTTTSTANVCQSFCPAGYVAVGSSCLPQSACGACYGYYSGYCYIGNGANSYYGY